MKQVTFFEETSQDLRQLFENGFIARRLKANETLFEQDDFDDRLYVLDKGVLEVCVYSGSGRKLSLNRLLSGSVFGEIAIFDPGPRTARIRALQDCELRSIRHSTLMAAVLDQPPLAIELLALAGKRMRWMSQQMQDQVFLSPAQLLAAKMLYLAGEDATIAMSQAQLADYVGVSREVVSKTLSDWRRKDIVTLTRGRITVDDADALEDIRAADLF